MPASTSTIHDQTTAGLDVITDGKKSRLDFNLSFYGCLNGISSPPRQYVPMFPDFLAFDVDEIHCNLKLLVCS